MEHFFELVVELLFGSSNHKPDKMPDDISYNPIFLVRHPVKKTLARIFATFIFIVVFSLLLIVLNDDTCFLFIIFISLFGILFVLSLVTLSFRCSVTEEYIKTSYWGLFCKYVEWNDIPCIKVVERTAEKSVIVAIYNEDGRCVTDLNTDMDNVWYVVKMAEEKNITVKHEKDLSLKQISHL